MRGCSTMSVNPAARPRWAPAALGAAIAIAVWSLAVAAWRSTHQLGLALSLFGLGLSLGPFLAAHRTAARPRKQAWRMAAMASGALGILAFTLIDAVGLDMEAFFALLFLGTAGAPVGHTLVTTIVGPLLFGRLLCGWGCWRALVLEHLPVRDGACQPAAWWLKMPYVGLAVSAGAGALSTLVLHVRPGGLPGHPRGNHPVHTAIAVLVYYALSIAFAFTFHDRRAFCKYFCPSGAVLRWTSRRSRLAVRSDPGLCTACGACDRLCPMELPVMDRAHGGGRVSDGRCILCLRCVAACPNGALRVGIHA